MSQDKTENSLLDRVLENEMLLHIKSIKSNNDLGVSQDYDSLKYDNVYKRNQFKDESFKGKSTQVCPYTGELLHNSTEAALNKYGMNHISKHTADTDHTIPKKAVHEFVKKNPYLSDGDVKSIANENDNFRVIQSKINRSKGSRSNIEIMDDNGLNASKMQKDHVRSSIHIAKNATILTVNNVTGEFAGGAKHSLESAAIPLMIEGVNNLILVAEGKKEFEKAASDMGRLGAVVAVSGGTVQVVTTGVENVLRNSASSALQKVANSNQVAQVIAVSLILKDSIVRYSEGEINSEEFFREIGEKGVGLVSGSIGAVIGQTLIPIPMVGAFIGSVIISTSCIEIYKMYEELKNSLDVNFEKTKHIGEVATAASYEIERQRLVLEKYISVEFIKMDQAFEMGFEKIHDSIQGNDIEALCEGLDSILAIYKSKSRFSNLQSFDEFFDDREAVLEI